MDFNPLNVLKYVKGKILTNFPGLRYSPLSIEESLFADDIYKQLMARLNHQINVKDSLCVVSDYDYENSFTSEFNHTGDIKLFNRFWDIDHRPEMGNTRDSDLSLEEEEDNHCSYGAVKNRYFARPGSINRRKDPEVKGDRASDKENSKKPDEEGVCKIIEEFLRSTADSSTRKSDPSKKKHPSTRPKETSKTNGDRKPEPNRRTAHVAMKTCSPKVTVIEQLPICRYCNRKLSDLRITRRHERTHCRAPGAPNHCCSDSACSSSDCPGKGVYQPRAGDSILAIQTH